MNLAVTPTGDREQAFQLCIRYMNSQTVPPDLWLIVDDGRTDAVRKHLPEIRIPYRILNLPPIPEHSLARNLREAFRQIKPDDRVCIIEDDDFYPETYLHTVFRMLNQFENIGARLHKYYNVRERKFWKFQNSRTMTLHSSGFAASAIPFFRHILETAVNYSVDARFGAEWPGKRGYNDLVPPVHILGFGSGRAGTTKAHRPDRNDRRWKPDPSGDQLRKWIGFNAKNYL